MFRDALVTDHRCMFTRASEIENLREELGRMRARVGEIDALRQALAAERAHSDPSAADRSTLPPLSPGAPMSATHTTSGILTRESFIAAATGALGRVRRSGEPTALMVVDIDGFRELNATHGSKVADAALGTVQRLLQTIGREGDLLARTGSDEFGVLLANTDVTGAESHAELLIRLLEDVAQREVGAFTVSVGVAPYSLGETIERLLANAAYGLDQARAHGGARVAVSVDGGAAERVAREEVDIDVAEALAAALLERDRHTGEHSRSVVRLSRSIAGVLGLDAAETDRIAAAALLHDIGKVALPDHILRKPSSLDEDEWDVVRELPLIGERILRAIPGLGDVARIVRHAHERFDGTGYPDGLMGQEIPIGSRIILACDTYQAMTSKNPYRDPLPHAEAVRELVTCAGTQFDPKVTEALIGDLHLYVQTGKSHEGQAPDTA